VTESVIQKGSGDRRPLVIAYHTPGDQLTKIHPTAAIWSFYGQPFTKQYFRAGAGVVRPLAELVASARAEGFEPDPLVTIGWSEGVQGVRAHLWEGSDARKMIGGIGAFDGAHAPTGFGGTDYIEPWEWAYEDAKDRELAFTWTTSRIPTTGYESTRRVAENILGPIEDGTRDEGFFRLIATPGAGAQEHIKHAQLVRTELPRLIELARQRSSGGGGIIGAIVGGVAGAVCGGAYKGKEGAAIGGVAGAAIGAIIGGL
jgi:fermentation-respiration switch protein FrsA (DUF1100 family)